MPSQLRLRLSLRDSDPAVLRELRVPADYSCYELHLALQVSLGWNDREPFELVRSKLTVGTEPSYAGSGLVHDGHHYRHADEVEAGELLQRVGQTVSYTYDFSRLWGFELTLLDRFDADSDLPACLRVEEAAPPEDVDDIETFYGLQLAYADDQHELHALAVAALGDDFDPTGPRADEVTEHLGLLFGEEVAPHGTDQTDDEQWGWWDPSKYDEAMRIRVLKEEIDEALPPRLAGERAADRSEALLDALRGRR